MKKRKRKRRRAITSDKREYFGICSDKRGVRQNGWALMQIYALAGGCGVVRGRWFVVTGSRDLWLQGCEVVTHEVARWFRGFRGCCSGVVRVAC